MQCTLQYYCILPYEYSATAQRTGMFLHGLCSHCRNVTAGSPPWFIGRKAGDGCTPLEISLHACLRIPENLRERLSFPLSISTVPSQHSQNGGELSLCSSFFPLLTLAFLSKKKKKKEQKIVVY